MRSARRPRVSKVRLLTARGLPNRAVLSRLMQTHFPTLAAKNIGDMKWKKFFYRQLCERAGVPICKSPHCADCCDFRVCFGPEDA